MKVVGWLLAGGAGLYLLDKMGYFGNLGSSVITAATTAVNTNTSTSPQANNATVATGGALQTLQSQVRQQVSQDGFFSNVNGVLFGTPYHWNFYVQQISGISVDLNAAFPGIDLSQPVSENVFWTAVSPQLVSRGIAGMGVIANRVNPYMEGPRIAQVRFGAGLAPTGVETYIFSKGQP